MRYILFLLLFLTLLGCGSQRINYGPYSIGRDPTWYPLQLEEKAPYLNAFTTSLAQKIAQLEALPIEMVDIGTQQLEEMLARRQIAAIFSALAPTVITRQKYNFSEPFFLLGPVLVVPIQSKVTAISDLSGGTIAVYQFDDSMLIAENNPDLVIVQYQNMGSALQNLSEGKMDALLMPVMEAEALVKNLYPNELKIVTAPLNEKAIRLITLKNYNDSLFKHFSQGLKRICKSGQFEKLRQEYSVRVFEKMTSQKNYIR